MNKRIIFTVLNAFLFLSIIRASMINGVVLDKANCPIPFASIAVSETAYVTSADQFGKFSIEDLPIGRYNLKVSCVGYNTKTVIVDVSHENEEYQITLEEVSIVLDEVVVTSTDMTTLILEKVLKTPQLKDLIPTYSAISVTKIESTGNLQDYPKDFRKLIRIMMALGGYKKIYNCIEKYPNINVAIKRNVLFENGKTKLSDGELIEQNETLTENEEAAFLRKKWGVDENTFDDMYKTIAAICKRQKSKKKAEVLSYQSSYVEESKNVHILKSEHFEFHILADCWQIYRMLYKDKLTNTVIECQKYGQNVYLPVYIHNEDKYDFDSDRHWSIFSTTSLTYGMPIATR